MVSRSLCYLFAAGLVGIAGHSVFAQNPFETSERPPFADEIFTAAPISLGGDSFSSAERTKKKSTPTILPTSLEDSSELITETTYASVEVPAPQSYTEEISTTAILDRLATVEAELYSLRSETIVSNLEEKLKKPTYSLGGRIHIDHWSFGQADEGIGWLEHPPTDPMDGGSLPIDGQDPEDRVLFRRVRLELKGENPANMFWRFQIDFAKSENSEFKDVYIGWDNLPHNQKLIVGHQKRPLGLDHWNSSRFNVFIERPFVVEAHNEDARRLGVGVWGESEDESLFWQYGVYQNENIVTDGEAVGDDLQVSLNGRLGGSWMSNDEEDWFHWAVAGQISWPDGDAGDGATNSNEGRFRTRPEARSDARWLNTDRIDGETHADTLAAEMMYNRGPLNLTAEAMFTHVNRSEASGPEADFYGYYAQASYFLTGDHMNYKRSVGSIDRPSIMENFDPFSNCNPRYGAWQVAARYSMLDLTDGDIQGGVGRSMTYSVNWWFSPYARIQFNAIRGSIAGHEDVMGFTGGDYTIYGTRYALDF